MNVEDRIARARPNWRDCGIRAEQQAARVDLLGGLCRAGVPDVLWCAALGEFPSRRGLRR